MADVCGRTRVDEINRPEIEAEVRDAVLRYESALTGNDIAVLNELFWQSARTVRYGATECLYGSGEIAAFRNSRPSQGLERTIERLEITSFGTDLAVANLEFRPFGRASRRTAEPDMGPVRAGLAHRQRPRFAMRAPTRIGLPGRASGIAAGRPSF